MGQKSDRNRLISAVLHCSESRNVATLIRLWVGISDRLAARLAGMWKTKLKRSDFQIAGISDGEKDMDIKI